jgi:hypothetical protein
MMNSNIAVKRRALHDSIRQQ